MVPWSDMILMFLKIGVLGFGGPFALLAFLEREVVQRRRWLTPEEFAHSTAIGTLTPGPIFWSTAVHVGYRLHRTPGAIVVGIVSLLPAFVLAVAFSAFYVKVESLTAVAGAAQAVTAALVGLLAVMAFRNTETLIHDLRGIALAVVCLIALKVLKLNVIWVIIAAAGVGIIMYGRTGTEEAPEGGRK